MKASDMAPVSPEVERKFDVDDGFVLPPLDGLPGVAQVGEPREYGLDATYLDTADLRLLRNRVTLRRRTGGEDAGWHLKRPRGDGEREELRQPLGRSVRELPPVLRAAAEVHLRGAEVVPVVRLRTRRRVTQLLNLEGGVLAEVADDAVIATVPAPNGRPASVRRWREVEVELVAGHPELLDAVGKCLTRAGARPSDSRSKLGRALSDRMPEPAAVASGDAMSGEVRHGRAGGVVLEHLRELVDLLLTQDPQARVDAVDGVHQMRVATRRLRTCLATFRPLFDSDVTDPVRAELAWLGTELGAVRDAEVIRDHLLEDLARQPSEAVIGPIRDRVVTVMRQRHDSAHAELLTALGDARYFALLDALDALLTTPPFTDLAAARADDALLPLVVRTWRRTDRLVRAADRAADAPQRDLLLHEVRKAAKRARYAGEALERRYGGPAHAFAARMKSVQQALGDHQDSVMIRQEILQLAVEAEQAGEPTFTYGRLHCHEELRGALSEADFTRSWDRAARPSLRAWLR
jgi:CHAD domain-containing protein